MKSNIYINLLAKFYSGGKSLLLQKTGNSFKYFGIIVNEHGECKYANYDKGVIPYLVRNSNLFEDSTYFVGYYKLPNGFKFSIIYDLLNCKEIEIKKT